MTFLRRSIAVSSALVATVVLSACGSAAASAERDGAPSAATNTELSTSAPLVLDNCGMDVTIEEPPSRVVTIKSTSTELMLALGLADHIVGTAFPDGPVPEPWTD